MSAKAVTPDKPSDYLVLNQVVSRAWISAGWRENPVTRVVPSKRHYHRRDNKRAITQQERE